MFLLKKKRKSPKNSFFTVGFVCVWCVCVGVCVCVCVCVCVFFLGGWVFCTKPLPDKLSFSFMSYIESMSAHFFTDFARTGLLFPHVLLKQKKQPHYYCGIVLPCLQ